MGHASAGGTALESEGSSNAEAIAALLAVGIIRRDLIPIVSAADGPAPRRLPAQGQAETERRFIDVGQRAAALQLRRLIGDRPGKGERPADAMLHVGEEAVHLGIVVANDVARFFESVRIAARYKGTFRIGIAGGKLDVGRGNIVLGLALAIFETATGGNHQALAGVIF